MTIQIDCPAEGDPHAVVLVSGTGVICTRGTFDVGRQPAQDVGLVLVYAKIYQGVQAGDNRPPPGTASTPPSAGSSWIFNPLGGATCSPTAPYPHQTIAVWVLAGGVMSPPTTGHFYGLCAGQVDCCDGSGPAVGASAAGYGAGALSGARQVLALAPTRWQVTGQDFPPGPRAAFNGRWLLALRGPADGHCVWDNGGDGVGTPRVELRSESPQPRTWQLLFRHGEVTGHYTRPADDWAPLGVNTLTAAGTDGDGPRSLAVTPV